MADLRKTNKRLEKELKAAAKPVQVEGGGASQQELDEAWAYGEDLRERLEAANADVTAARVERDEAQWEIRQLRFQLADALQVGCRRVHRTCRVFCICISRYLRRACTADTPTPT